MERLNLRRRKNLLIAGHLITSKAQAYRLASELNNESCASWEEALAADQILERIVNAGFLTWEEAYTAF